MLEYLRLILPELLGLPFRIVDHAIPPDSAYDPLRRQWNATQILEILDGLPEARSATRVLGVTDHDLFIPILTFVFGMAQLDARCALVSLRRLMPEFYGLAPDRDLVLRRLEKEALHELGHNFGLRHCLDGSCVMHYSNTVEEVDLKEARFCPHCRALGGLR